MLNSRHFNRKLDATHYAKWHYYMPGERNLYYFGLIHEDKLVGVSNGDIPCLAVFRWSIYESSHVLEQQLNSINDKLLVGHTLEEAFNEVVRDGIRC